MLLFAPCPPAKVVPEISFAEVVMNLRADRASSSSGRSAPLEHSFTTSVSAAAADALVAAGEVVSGVATRKAAEGKEPETRSEADSPAAGAPHARPKARAKMRGGYPFWQAAT